MAKRSSQSEAVFKGIGKLAIRWNDLEVELRRLACELYDDWFLVAMFTADMQASALLRAIRPLAEEYDVETRKLNRFLEQAHPVTKHDVPERDLICEHVSCVLKCADRLRLYRNLYVHGVSSWEGSFILGGITTKANNRFSQFEFPLRLPEIRKVSAAVERTVRYSRKV